MAAEMLVALDGQTLAADVAHAVATQADELVAAFRLDKAEVALRTGAFYRVRCGALKCEAERGELGGEAGVGVVPGERAGEA